jgi:AcrR family transcriptional regulator
MSVERLPGNERRDQIVAATAPVFAERGYRGATTAELAEAAGISDGLIFRYFPTKADLYSAVLDRAVDGLERCVRDRVRPDATPEQKLEETVRATAGFAVRDPDAWRNLTSSGGDEWLLEKQHLLYRRAVSSVSDLMANDAKSRNRRISPKQLERYATLAAGAGIALVNLWIAGVEAEPILAFFTGGVWAGLDGGSGASS